MGILLVESSVLVVNFFTDLVTTAVETFCGIDSTILAPFSVELGGIA